MDFIKTADKEGKEKHAPVILVTPRAEKAGVHSVKVVVGYETPHPNTDKHYIQSAELYGKRKDNGELELIGKALWAPLNANPTLKLEVLGLDRFSSLHALSYCNIHGIWGNSLEL